MEPKKTLDSDYFKEVYAANEDPWDFETSEYEAEKYSATIAALPKDFYENALEIGCSIGVLTKMLSEKCGHLLSTDVSEVAIRKSKERCKNLANVTFKRQSFADGLPEDLYDLIMISEVAYYLSPEDWEVAAQRLFGKLQDKGNIFLIHWLPEVHDYPQSGDEVHESFRMLMEDKMKNVFNSRAENYRIDVWEKC